MRKVPLCIFLFQTITIINDQNTWVISDTLKHYWLIHKCLNVVKLLIFTVTLQSWLTCMISQPDGPLSSLLLLLVLSVLLIVVVIVAVSQGRAVARRRLRRLQRWRQVAVDRRLLPSFFGLLFPPLCLPLQGFNLQHSPFQKLGLPLLFLFQLLLLVLGDLSNLKGEKRKEKHKRGRESQWKGKTKK